MMRRSYDMEERAIGVVARLRAQDDLLTVAEVAKILRCGRTTVYKMMVERQIEYVTTRCGRRFDPGAVADWVVKNSIAAIDPELPLRPRSRHRREA